MAEKRDLEQSPSASASKTLQGNAATEVVYHDSDVFGEEEGHDVGHFPFRHTFLSPLEIRQMRTLQMQRRLIFSRKTTFL